MQTGRQVACDRQTGNLLSTSCASTSPPACLWLQRQAVQQVHVANTTTGGSHSCLHTRLAVYLCGLCTSRSFLVTALACLQLDAVWHWHYKGLGCWVFFFPLPCWLYQHTASHSLCSAKRCTWHLATLKHTRFCASNQPQASVSCQHRASTGQAQGKHRAAHRLCRAQCHRLQLLRAG